MSLQRLNDFKFERTNHVIEEHGGFVGPYFCFIGIALTLGLIAASLVSYIEVSLHHLIREHHVCFSRSLLEVEFQN